VLEALRPRAGRFGLDLVMVNVWEGEGVEDEVKRYCQMWNIQATVLLDETARYARALGVRGVPTNVLVDEGGIVRAFGASTGAELVRDADRLVPGLAAVCEDLPGLEREPAGFAER
jgi:thioredoxin-like negative regulator of GroEL